MPALLVRSDDIMHIAFFASSCLPFHGRTLDQRPLGGIETGVIRLGEALVDAGHEVTILTAFDNPPLTRALYLPLRSFPLLGAVDVAVIVRDWKLLNLPIECRKRVFWTGDAADQFTTIGLGDLRVSAKIDLLLAVSEWHRVTLCDASGFPLERCRVLRNGVYLPYFQQTEERGRKALIYSSTPYRGLKHLPRLFKRIRKAHPDASLYVCSSYDVYAGSGPPPAHERREFEAIKQELIKIPGVLLMGSLLQRELALQMLRSAVLAYPNTFAETSCITAMEAKTAGCVVVTSKKGALPETVGKGGALIDGDPGEGAYDDAFVDAVVTYLSDDRLFSEVSAQNRKEAIAELGWNTRAEEFVKMLSNEM